MNELEISIQAVSSDFMQSQRQKLFSFDNERPLLDLLFYHRGMECFIPVYLKFGDVNSDEIEWMKINLRILAKYKEDKVGNNPVRIILCVLDNKQHVEFVKLEQSKGTKNLIERPLKLIFRRKLKDAILQAQKQLTSGFPHHHSSLNAG
ncbi:MAG: DUF1016 domain-containing protein [Desulfobacterales bacterium]|nr:DUF1016 domain-containing protein [Desulfobacterales bacterium]